MRRFALPAALLLATLAAWLSQATLAVATLDGPRIALLPTSRGAVVAAAAAAAAVLVAYRAGLSLAPIGLLVLVILPWIPVPVPAAFLIWSGSLRWLVWYAVTLLLVAPLVPGLLRRLRASGPAARMLERPRLLAGALALLLFGWSAWQVSPSVPGGDEPHYLVIAQSLLLDGDLQIENNHRRGDYQSYFAGPLPPHYIQRGRNGEIYSIHAPGLPALIAPAFALGGYPLVVLLLIVIAACGSALAWHLAFRATGSSAAAWFGWAAVTCAGTTIFHAFTVYPDGLGSTIVLTGVWALLRAADERTSGATSLRPWFLHGAALALLPWMHSRFALLAGGLGALVLLRLPATRNPAGKAVAFLAVPALSALCWLSFFLVIYGRPDPSAPYGVNTGRDFSLSFVPGGLTGLLFDQRFGLIANAPVLLFGLIGLGLMLYSRRSTDRGPTEQRRLGLELLFVMTPYLIASTSYAMWWAGWSAPARFANPAVPLLAIPCAVAWLRVTHPATRMLAAGSLTFTVFLSFVLVAVEGGRLAYNTRETTALWLDWAARLNPLGQALPVWYRGRELVFARDVLVWTAGLVLAYLAIRALWRLQVLRDRTRYGTLAAGIFAGAAMVLVTVVWKVESVEPIAPAPAQLDLLRKLAHEPRAVAALIAPPQALTPARLLSMLRIDAFLRAGAGTGTGRNEQPLVAFSTVPAGRYRLQIRSRGPGGWLILGINQDQFALHSGPLPYPPTPVEVSLPVDVRALIVRGDEEARRTVRSVSLQPEALVPIDVRLTDRVARRGVVYDHARVFFLDEGCFPEPDAFWVGGSRQCAFVVEPSRPASAVRVRLRNAPVPNHITIESGQWREALALQPGEERQLHIPLAPGRPGALVSIASRSGFRPSESVKESRDQRFLGVWLEVLE